MRCPRCLNLFFLNAARLSNNSNAIDSDYHPAASNSLQNTQTQPFHHKNLPRSRRESTERESEKLVQKMEKYASNRKIYVFDKLEFDDAIAYGDSQRQLRNFRRKCIVSEENA